MKLITLLLVVALVVAQPRLKDSYQSCIVGAGPGGLQLGHYMQQAQRDYVILERAATAGYFFDVYPRHRKLISLNKRFTGRVDKEFNLRHDWNSLLDNSIRPMTNRSIERFPPADVLVQYLREFGETQRDNIIFNTSVELISRTTPESDFTVRVDSQGAIREISCHVVVMATGLWVPNKPTESIPGLELAVQYQDLPTTGESYQEKTVAVLGMGNSALETADAISPYVNYVHVLNLGSGFKQPSWESRYPGSPRAINAGVFDSYLLKSLDGGFKPIKISMHECTYSAGDRKNPSYEDVGRLLRDAGGKTKRICVFPLVPRDDSDEQFIGVPVPDVVIRDGWGKAAIEALADVATIRPSTIPLKTMFYKVYRQHATSLLTSAVQEHFVQIHVSNVTAANVDILMRLAATSGTPFPLVYDTVISCLGWKHNTTLYDTTAAPDMQPNNKYAVMNSKYESVNVPNLYFAGTLSHGKDMKRSAGAFIHGFRYTARALHRILEQQQHSAQWPSTRFVCTPTGIDELLDLVMSRINTASGPYQMIGTLADAILFQKDGVIKYLEEVPISYLHENHHTVARVLWSFAYWNQRQSFETSVNTGTLFEIHMWSQAASKKMRRPHSRDFLRLIEAFHTDWDNEYVRANVRMYLANSASKAAGKNCMPQVHKLAAAWKESLLTDPSAQREGSGSPNVPLDGWTPVQVDLHAYNSLQVPVELKVNQKPMGTLAPATGKVLDSYDGDIWQVREVKGGRAVLSMTIELGKGKVQDLWISHDDQSTTKLQDATFRMAQSDTEEEPVEEPPSKCQRLKGELKQSKMMVEKLQQMADTNAKAQEKLKCKDEA